MTENNRSLSWWVRQIFVSILAPLGIVGGPIALASMFRSIIEWKGPIGYTVHFWSEYVSPPFTYIFTWIADLLLLPAPPLWLTDYLIMGLLVASSYLRGWMIVPLPRNADIQPPRWWKFLRHIVLWPYGLYRTLSSVRRHGVMSIGGLSLTFAPILIFLVLLTVNWAAL